MTLLASGLSDAAQARSRQRDDVVEASMSLSGQPVLAVVSLQSQRVSIYDAHGNALRSPVSTGQSGLDTPVGVYSVLEKDIDHTSNIFEGAEMPFMQRITWSGVALHAGVIPGYPASHGCVRMPYGFAQQLYPLTKLNMRVVINYADVAPVPFSHSLLFKPVAPNEKIVAQQAIYADDEDLGRTNPFQPDVRKWPSRQAQLDELRQAAADKTAVADEATAAAAELKPMGSIKTVEKNRAAKALAFAKSVRDDAQDKLEKADRAILAAKTPKALATAEAAKAKLKPAFKEADAKFDAAQAKFSAAEREFQAVNREWSAAEARRMEAVAVAREAMRMTQPVSAFISLKTKRIYVRQGNEPVFDAPVTIADPDTPIGTHIFTAMDYSNEGKDLQWTVVSIGLRSPDAGGRVRLANLQADAPPTDASKAAAALDRITIAPDVAAKISGYVWPTSSLIVSDEDISKETGKATDFIVLISGEPQGGIKRRPKPKPIYRDPWGFDDEYSYDRKGRRYYKQPSFFSFW